MKKIGQANRNEGSWKKEHRQGRHPRDCFIQHVRERWKKINWCTLSWKSCPVGWKRRFETRVGRSRDLYDYPLEWPDWKKDWFVFPFALCNSWPIVLFRCFWMRSILKFLWLMNRWYCWKVAWGIYEVLGDTEFPHGYRLGPPEWYESTKTSDGALPLLLRYAQARNSGWNFFPWYIVSGKI